MTDWIWAVLIGVGVWLAAHGWSGQHLIAGFAGGISRVIISKSGTLTERIVGGFTGSLFAVYLTPLIAWFLGIPDPSIVNAIAFSVGLLGLHIGEIALNIAKDWSKHPGKFKEDMRDLLLRILTKKE